VPRDLRDKDQRPWKTYEDREEEFEKQPFWTSFKWLFGAVAIVLVLVALIAIATWGFGVGTSGVKGTGDIRKENNSALNRVQQQAYFEDTKASFDGALVKISVARAALAQATDERDKSQRRVELDGLVQNCVDTAQAYNAQSKKQLAADWKRAGLPKKLNATKCSGA
jgi:hypothetical protein